MGELTDRMLRMMTKQGFTELFWEELGKGGGDERHEDVYERLEREYVAAFGRRRYASFGSFRRRRDEMARK